MYGMIVLAMVAIHIWQVAWMNQPLQAGQPDQFPITPPPAECQVAPRPLEFYEPFVLHNSGSPIATPVGAQTPTVDQSSIAPTPTLRAATPRGSAADGATHEAIVLTVREMVACRNAGDRRRVEALFTDRYVLKAITEDGIDQEQWLELLEVPRPLNEQDWLILLLVDPPIRLQGGGLLTAVVLAVANEPSRSFRWFLHFEFERGRYRIDEVIVER